MKLLIMVEVISVRAEVSSRRASMGARAAATEWVTSASTVMSVVAEAMERERTTSGAPESVSMMPLRETSEKPCALAVMV
jgi:hypothetical protein